MPGQPSDPLESARNHPEGRQKGGFSRGFNAPSSTFTSGDRHLRVTVLEKMTMMDALYIAGTFVFFALVLAYVAACEALGRDTSSAEDKSL
jgi:hypothetical protein